MLDGLTTRKLARRELARVLRRTMVYLMFLLLLAAVLLSFFSEFIVPTILFMRSDMTLVPSAATQHAGTTDWASTLAMVYASAYVVVFLMLLTGGPAFITWCLGGRKYQTSRESATVLRVAERLVAHNTPQDHAIELAVQLCDPSPAVRDQVDRAAQVADGDSARSGDWGGAAVRFHHAAADRLATLRIVLPVFLLIVVGGTATLLYSLTLFWPIVALLLDLALPVVQT